MQTETYLSRPSSRCNGNIFPIFKLLSVIGFVLFLYLVGGQRPTALGGGGNDQRYHIGLNDDVLGLFNFPLDCIDNISVSLNPQLSATLLGSGQVGWVNAVMQCGSDEKGVVGTTHYRTSFFVTNPLLGDASFNIERIGDYLFLQMNLIDDADNIGSDKIVFDLVQEVIIPLSTYSRMHKGDDL